MIMVASLPSVASMPFSWFRFPSAETWAAPPRHPCRGLAAAVFVAGAVGPGAAVASAAPADGHDRGRLVAATHLRTQSRRRPTDELAATGFATDTARYGADSYRLEYATVDVRNRPTTASGCCYCLAAARGAAHRG